LQLGCFLWVLLFPPPIKHCHDKTEILLKVVYRDIDKQNKNILTTPKNRENSGAHEEQAVPASYKKSTVLLIHIVRSNNKMKVLVVIQFYQ
jgi:hypothetical protein